MALDRDNAFYGYKAPTPTVDASDAAEKARIAAMRKANAKSRPATFLEQVEGAISKTQASISNLENSKDLPRSKTMFNIHRAKKIGDRVIVVESIFDAIRVHQAGFPNVVATLGGHISGQNLNLLNRYFNTVIIMTDADKAGRDLGSTIAYKLSNKNILWASHSYGRIYPEGVKDAGDMSDEDIKACVTNAISNFEYRT